MPHNSSTNNNKLYNIEDALHNFNTLDVDDECSELYKANYLFMKQSPMYVRLEQKYKNLKKKLREQSKMIELLNRQYFETVEKYAARTPSVTQERGVSEDVRELPEEYVSSKVIKLEPISVVRTDAQIDIVEDELAEIIVVEDNVKNTKAITFEETEFSYDGLPSKDNKPSQENPPSPSFVPHSGLVTNEEVEQKKENNEVDVVEEDETEEVDVVEEEVEVQEEVEQEEEVVEEEETEEVEVEVEQEETEEVEVEVEQEEEVVEEEETEEVEVEVEQEEEVVEEEETEEVEVEEEEDTEEVEVEVEQEEETEEQEEEGVYETVINGKKYYITNETDGEIYAILEDEDIGDVVGKYVNGVPTFTKK
jgi:hypothetical protein